MKTNSTKIGNDLENGENNKLKAFCDDLEAAMKEKLEAFRLDESDLSVRCNKAITVVAGTLHELKEFIRTYTFPGAADEIQFFKQMKPVFLSQYFFYERVLFLKINEPASVTTSAIVSYYRDELEQIGIFSRMNADFIRYCQSESSQFDDKYFVRGFVPVIDFATDREFSTVYDERLSRVLANRLLKEHILSIIEAHNASGDTFTSSLTWTHSKADLIELIYGLETIGAINKGEADIKEIARRFEAIFNINLGNFYRQFLDIRLRKKGKTVFLHNMIEKLEIRMDDFK